MKIRPVIHHDAIPAGVPFNEWTSTLDGWLYLQLPGGGMLTIAPRGRFQVARADLARVPRLAAWLEGCELRGVLRASDPP